MKTGTKAAAREARLGQALRQNLRRRKAGPKDEGPNAAGDEEMPKQEMPKQEMKDD